MLMSRGREVAEIENAVGAVLGEEGPQTCIRRPGAGEGRGAVCGRRLPR